MLCYLIQSMVITMICIIYVRTYCGYVSTVWQIVGSSPVESKKYIYCFSTTHAELRSKNTYNRWLGIRTICCLTELTQYNPKYVYWSSKKQISSQSHLNLACFHHDIAEKLFTWRLTTITHVLTEYMNVSKPNIWVSQDIGFKPLLNIFGILTFLSKYKADIVTISIASKSNLFLP